MFLSLCMPTNGISEWVFPALNSIYESGVDCSTFEVVVTNNGNDANFDMRMREYKLEHANLVYSKTDSYMFDNQLDALKLARGDYMKFVNHRSIWKPGRLQYMIDFLSEHEKEKPVIFFSNGVMGWGPNYREYEDFNSFIADLGVTGTWTSGVGVWRSQYTTIISDFKYDRISPHSGILYGDRKSKKYIINDKIWMEDIISDHRNKGQYNLYKAFAIDEFIIYINLYRDGSITEDTLIKVKESFRSYLVGLYREFNLKKVPCSYDLSGFEKYLNVFFNADSIKKEAECGYDCGR